MYSKDTSFDGYYLFVRQRDTYEKTIACVYG